MWGMGSREAGLLQLSALQYSNITKGVSLCNPTTHTMLKETIIPTSGWHRAVWHTDNQINLKTYVGHTTKKISCLEVWHNLSFSKGTWCVFRTSEIVLQQVMKNIPHSLLHIFTQSKNFNVFVTALLSHSIFLCSIPLYIIMIVCHIESSQFYIQSISWTYVQLSFSRNSVLEATT